MYTAKIENAAGELLELTQGWSKWQVLEITGLNPPKTQVNLTNVAGMDGAKLNSAKLDARNIVITIRLLGNVEQNRLELYQYFRTKEEIIFYFANERRSVKISGIVESVECNLFSAAELVQASIICPSPYFSALEEIEADISSVVALFMFPFSINDGHPIAISEFTANRIAEVVNDSETETGVTIEVNFTNAVQKVRIYNVDTGEFLLLEGAFHYADKLTINTNSGHKGVYLTRGGTTKSLFSALGSGSSFFQLRAGTNRFSYVADDGASDAYVSIIFKYSTKYRGV